VDRIPGNDRVISTGGAPGRETHANNYKNQESRRRQELRKAKDSTEQNPSSSGKTWLLSPLGLSPGLLYSALVLVKPQALVVVTSGDGKARLEEIIEKSGYQGEKLVLTVDDAFICFDQGGAIAGQVIEASGPDDTWVINLTGGTTGLQYIIQRTGDQLRSQGHKVRYVAMVDRRPVLEQKENPYMVGELVYVE